MHERQHYALDLSVQGRMSTVSPIERTRVASVPSAFIIIESIEKNELVGSLHQTYRSVGRRDRPFSPLPIFSLTNKSDDWESETIFKWGHVERFARAQWKRAWCNVTHG